MRADPTTNALIREAMSLCDMFDGAKDVTQDRMLESARVREYKSGDTLFWENDPTGLVYLVCTGQVAIERFSEDNRTVTITHRNPGDVIGEISLFEHAPRTADVRATEDSKVAIIEGELLLQCIREDPDLAMGVIRSLARKLHQSIDRKMEEQWKVSRRLAGLLVELARKGSTKIEGKGHLLESQITQEEMAASLNCSREHVNRAIKQFRTDGIIAFEGRRIIIRSPKRLKALAGETEI